MACIPVHAQQITKEDSMRRLLQTSKTDTHRVMQLLAYGELFETSKPDTALYYYDKAKVLAEKLQYKKGLAAFTSYAIVVLNNKGRFREALELCKENVLRWEGTGNKQELAAAYINVGSEWQYLGDLETAAANYIRAVQYAEAIQHQAYQRVANNNLAAVFNSLQQYRKGLQYAQKALTIARALNNDYAIASSLINIATSQTSLQQHDTATVLFKQVETLGEKMQDDILRMDGWLGMADNYKATRQWATAATLYKKTITLSLQAETPEYQLYGCMGLSDLFIKTKQWSAAEQYVTTGRLLAQSLGTRLELKELYLRTSEIQEATGNAGAALAWHKKFVLLSDSLFNEKNMANINAQEIKYETGKKEIQIKELEAAKKVQALTIQQNKIVTYMLIGSSLSLLLIALLGYRGYRQKQQLQQQEIASLQKEKKLLATNAVLQGQEEERSRLAKDLHDGLGGMLSGIKYTFGNMKENLLMTPGTQQSFNRAMDMLDSSINEMRRVAHSMMPEALLKFGLDAALKDFCTSIHNSGIVKVVYQSYNIHELNIGQTEAVIIYRVVQELLNNSIKHAAATQVVVQLNHADGKLLITVEDNGKGFDARQLHQAAGIGWTNIYSRINYLNGKADIQSSPGNGTAVNIEIAI